MNACRIRFYEELNDFLPSSRRKIAFTHEFNGTPSVKDLIESLGPPHVEVDLILVNGRSVDFDYLIRGGEEISVYPVFESLDIKDATRLRPEPLRDIKFVIDVNLGKLTRYLRLLGFDCYYRNDLDDPEIVEIAVREKRIVLTRDQGILKTGGVQRGYWPRSQDSREQLREVIRRFDLRDKIRPFSRCADCNGRIQPTDKNEVAPELEEETRRSFDEFYRCAECRKIYWKGSHYDRLTEFLEELASEPAEGNT